MAGVVDLEPGVALPEYTVVAFNSASESENKIHDDTVARQYGFSGGLVPGVTVFAYMVPPVVSALGDDWISWGRMSARFVKPVYEGERTAVRAVPRSGDDGIELELEVHNPAGELCATGSAGFLPEDGVVPPTFLFDVAELPAEREPVSEEALRRREVLGVLHATATRESIDKFLAEARDEDERWRGNGAPVHPGYLVRWANTILASNVRLNPWIHVSSDVALIGVLRAGDAFETRGRVVDLFERKGHRFVRLDVLMIGPDDEPVMRVDHTAIYDIRRVDGD
jgi:acyl dehydratase